MNEEVKDLYDKIMEQVEKLDDVRDTDKVIIEQLAFNIYTVDECQKILQEQGFVQDGLHGAKEHPAVNVKNKAQQQIRTAYILLGIDFSSQLKKKVVDKDTDDWADFK